MKQSEEIKILLEALKYFYPGYFGEEPHSTANIFEYKGQKYSKDWVLTETFKISKVPAKTSDIAVAIRELENIYSSSIVETQEAPVEANRPGKEQLETFEKEAEERSEKIKQTQAQSKQDVEATLKRKQEIYDQQEIYNKKIEAAKVLEEKLKNQKLYYKVENEAEASEQAKNLKQQAEAHPKRFVKDVSEQFINSPAILGLSPQEAKIATEQAALTTYDTLFDNSPLVQIAVLKNIASDPKMLAKLAPNSSDQKALQDSISFLIDQKSAQYKLAQQFLNLTKMSGLPEDGAIKVTFSETSQNGFREFDINQNIATPYRQNLDNGNFLIGTVGGFGEQEIKSRVLLAVGGQIEKRIATLPANSLLAQTYRTEFVQGLVLPYLGLAEVAPFVATEGSLLGNVIVSSGYGPVAGFIQSKFGVDLGVKLLAETGIKAAAEVGVEVGAEAAAEGTVGVGVTAALAASLTPFLGLLAYPAAFLIETVIIEGAKKIWNSLKDNAHKYSKWIMAGAGVLLGATAGLSFGFGALLGGVLGGLGGAGLYSLASGGVSGLGSAAASFGHGTLNFFGALGGALAASIGGPIIATLVGFPVAVALILFIINSGAYVVPPGESIMNYINGGGEIGGQSLYIDVQKTANPPGPFQNSDLPLQITYTITIGAKIQALTNVTVQDDCTVIMKSGSQKCTATATNPPNGTIAVGNPYSFTYTANYNSSYKDALVTNTVTVTADTSLQSGTKASASSSVVIGNPPTGCFTFDNSWNSSDKARELLAITKIIPATTYIATLCSGGPITLRRVGSGGGCGGGGGEVTGNIINIYNAGVNCSDFVTFYTLAHETGHVYANRTNKYQMFQDSGAMSERLICTYPNALTPAEDFAEMIALYYTKVAGSTKASCMSGTLKTAYPLHWKFAHDNIFMQNLGW